MGVDDNKLHGTNMDSTPDLELESTIVNDGILDDQGNDIDVILESTVTKDSEPSNKIKVEIIRLYKSNEKVE